MGHRFLNERGFSLAELLVVTAVLGLILSAVILIQQKGQEAYVMGSNRVEAQQNARVALDLMTRELRSAQGMLTLGSATDLTFLDQNNVQVQYQLSGTDLNRISGGTTTTIIKGVRAGPLGEPPLVMTYCKAWNDCTSTPPVTIANVTVIRIQLTATTEEAAATNSLAYQRAKVESAVRLRNVNM